MVIFVSAKYIAKRRMREVVPIIIEISNELQIRKFDKRFVFTLQVFIWQCIVFFAR